MDSLDDFKGLRTRSYRPPLTELLEAIGAEPHFVDYFDVYDALEDGLVDAAISCGTCGFKQGWYEVADYLYGPINGSSSVTWIVMNRDRWDEIPPEFQAIITEEGNRHWEYVRDLAVGEWEGDAIDENIEDGMIHSPLSPEIHEAMFRANLDNVLPRWVERAGGPCSEAVRIFNEIIGPIIDVQIYADGSVAYPGPAKAKGNTVRFGACHHQGHRYPQRPRSHVRHALRRPDGPDLYGGSRRWQPYWRILR